MYSVSQLIASTSISFLLKNDSRTIVIDFMNNFDIDSLLMQLHSDGFHSDKNLSLHFDNIKGNDLLPVIDIYLNLEQENRPKENNFVGSMALYGLGESSVKTHEHDGAGQHRVFDVGQVFNKVRSQSNWDKKQFSVTLIPYHSLPVEATLTIGRVALYFNKD
jgi:hypothetical protein